MLNVGLANFTQEVIKAPGPVLVDFYSNTCGPCRLLKPVLAKVAEQGVKVVGVDIDAEPELTQHFGIQGVPTVIAFGHGKAGERVVGVKPAADLVALAGTAA